MNKASEVGFGLVFLMKVEAFPATGRSVIVHVNVSQNDKSKADQNLKKGQIVRPST